MIRATLLHICFCLLPLLAYAQDASQTAASPQKTQSAGYNGGEDNPQDPNDAGAQGTQKGAFTLSKGALAAIIVVAVLVGLGGAGSAVLFWLAKKRQWDVRQSLRRASRRLTGRSNVANKRENRRTGVRLNSPPAPKNRDRDVEKGAPSSGRTGTTTTITSTFDVDTPTPKGWKASVLGGKK